MFDTEDITFGCCVVGLIAGIILLIFGAVAGLSYVSQLVEKKVWGEYEYVIYQDNQYYYTHEVKEENGCIRFVDNYDNQNQLCEKYDVRDNYWHSHSPSLKTLIWSP